MNNYPTFYPDTGYFFCTNTVEIIDRKVLNMNIKNTSFSRNNNTVPSPYQRGYFLCTKTLEIIHRTVLNLNIKFYSLSQILHTYFQRSPTLPFGGREDGSARTLAPPWTSYMLHYFLFVLFLKEFSVDNNLIINFLSRYLLVLILAAALYTQTGS